LCPVGFMATPCGSPARTRFGTAGPSQVVGQPTKEEGIGLDEVQIRAASDSNLARLGPFRF
jgi:hypothetical protein